MNMFNGAPKMPQFNFPPEIVALLQNPNNMNPHKLEQLCRYFCQQKGLDFNQIMTQAQQIIKQYKQ